MRSRGTGAPGRPAPTAELLRAGLIGLVALGVAGTAVELAFLRHWDGPSQLVVWPAIGVLALAVGALAVRPSRGAIRFARLVALGVGVVALVGVVFHALENVDAGALDRLTAATWDARSAFDQWLAAITGEVGPAPTLAPGVLVQLALGTLLATVRHPALGEGGEAGAG